MDEGQPGDHKEFLLELGRRIRQIRKARRLSQEEVAFAAGITQHYLSQVEQGDRNVTVITIRALAKALKVTISELFEGIN